jgi:hypothetical protein
MSSGLNGGAYALHSVVPFAPKTVASNDADQLDKAGQTILELLHKAAGVAEANSQHALEMAQKLSHHLRAAENRIAELEAEVGIYQEKADRAEQWLHKVYTEIEDRFLRQDNGGAMTGAPQRKKISR